VNSSQRNSLRRACVALNKTLRLAETLAATESVDEIVYRWENPLPPEKRQEAAALAMQIRAVLRRSAKEWDLLQLDEDLLATLRDELKERWSDIEEHKSSGLRRLGEVDRRLKDELDPELVRLQVLVQRLAQALGREGDSR
jgi:hypothetical protein